VSWPRSTHGVAVYDELCTRYGLDRSEPAGAQLAERGILTDAEGRWLDEED
jgi:hypothetical protein